MIDYSKEELYCGYLDYYSNRDVERRDKLLQLILRHGSPVELNIEPPTYSIDSISLTSNGSTTNKLTTYQFGPHPIFWLYNIERRLRGPGVHVGIYNPFQFSGNQAQFKLDRLQGHPQLDFQLLCEIRLSPQLMINELRNLHERHGVLNLVAHPHIWLFLFGNEQFREFITESRWIRSIVNTDDDPFFNTSLPLYYNNQMMNWKTGINFYTCEYNHIHSLPLFSSSHMNLLNMCESLINDDLYLVTGKSQCQCGLESINMKFIPHISHQIMRDDIIYRPLELANKLTTNYLNIQFHQSDTTINVYYSTFGQPMSITDKDLIKHHFANFNVRFVKDTMYYIGRKIPIFRRGPIPCLIPTQHPFKR